MTLKILHVVFLIPFLVGCSKNISEESEKYKFYLENDNKNIVIVDEYGKDVLLLRFDENDSIESIHVGDHKGFNLSVGRVDGALSFYIVGDDNVMYHNLTQLDPTNNDVLVESQEQFQTISKKYQLFDDGQIEIEHWDYINQAWVSDEEFRKQFE